MDEWVAERTKTLHVCKRAQLAADWPLLKTRVRFLVLSDRDASAAGASRSTDCLQDSVHRTAAKKLYTQAAIIAAPEYREMSDRAARFLLEAFVPEDA